jgi:hypothetical protein
MRLTDAEPKPRLKVSLKEIDDILDRIAALSSFLSLELKGKVNTKHA